MKAAKGKGPQFEQAIGELESIIDRIESGDCGLEECIAQYEKGVKLLGHCQTILQAVQQRIAELTSDEKGRLSVEGESASGGAGEAGEAADEVEALEAEEADERAQTDPDISTSEDE